MLTVEYQWNKAYRNHHYSFSASNNPIFRVQGKVKWISQYPGGGEEKKKQKNKKALMKKNKNNWNVHERLNNGLKDLPVPGSWKRQNKTYQFITKADSDKRTILANTQTSMTMALQAIAYFCSLLHAVSVSHALSLHHRWLLVSPGEGKAAPP